MTASQSRAWAINGTNNPNSVLKFQCKSANHTVTEQANWTLFGASRHHEYAGRMLPVDLGFLVYSSRWSGL
jgi:hypothetical protein